LLFYTVDYFYRVYSIVCFFFFNNPLLIRGFIPLGTKQDKNHRIIELLRLEKTLKIIKSNRNLTRLP